MYTENIINKCNKSQRWFSLPCQNRQRQKLIICH